MLLERLKRLLGTTSWALLVSCVLWFLLLELYIFAFSRAGIALKDYLQPPYKERVTNFVVGTRNQTWDNLSIAEQMHKKVRIHCLLHLTNNHERRKAMHVLKTWGARCNRMHISKASDAAKAYRRIASTQYLDLDWLLHVHVDSYVIMENVRYKLASYAPDQLIYFSAFHAAYPYAHVSLRDTTDYIFSRGALQQLLREHECLPNNFAACLAKIEQGPNEQLFPFQVPAEVLPFTMRSEFWIWPYIHRAVYTEQGFNSNMEMPITFPYATANQLHVIEYLLYHLRPYGHINGMPALPPDSVVQLPALSADDTVARQLYKQVRILCVLLTYPHNYEKVAKSIRQTWGRHCNKLIVFSSRKQKSTTGVPTVALNVTEGYDYLWGKAKAAFKHVYTHHLDEADWFFKADDDTYAIIDNMRYMLHTHQPDEPVYFGCKFKPYVEQGYMSGGAGYVLSREAVRRLVEHGLNSGRCNENQMGTEDFEMGLCLTKCNVSAGDSRDPNGRHRFLPLTLESMIIPGSLAKDFWLYDFAYYKFKEGLECCSTYATTIHYVVYYQMYMFEYLLYKMHPYGIIMGHEPPTQNVSSTDTHNGN